MMTNVSLISIAESECHALAVRRAVVRRAKMSTLNWDPIHVLTVLFSASAPPSPAHPSSRPPTPREYSVVQNGRNILVSLKSSTPHFRSDFGWATVFTFSRFAPRRALRCLRSHAPRSVARRAASSPAMLTPPAGGAQPPQARALPLTFYPCGRRATRTAPCDAKHGRESPRSSAP